MGGKMGAVTLFELEDPELNKVCWSDMAVTLNFDEKRILQSIMKLHNDGQPFDVDPCYSRGVFWRGLPKPKHKFDIRPQATGVIEASATDLPLDTCSVQSVMFDPPFVIKGITNRELTGIIEKRFFAYPTYLDLITFYRKALCEFWRILRPGGIVAFKCQDTISGGKQYLTHVDVCNAARDAGYYVKDLFVLGRHNVIWSPNMANQQHARKNHSYYLVLRKDESI